ncbi:MAG: hypothetical protein J5528_01590 [Firmicutes bacterium]|nr:hypothetical protein [Bacillota bacterium]
MAGTKGTDKGKDKKEISEGILSGLLLRAGAVCPFFRIPIENVKLIADSGIKVMGTDGINIYFDPSASFGDETLRHLLMHCLSKHMLGGTEGVRTIRDLACDVSAEYLRAIYFPDESSRALRMSIEDALPERVDPRNAGEVYKAVMDLFEEDIEKLKSLVTKDDHSYWYGPYKPGMEAWEHTSEEERGEKDVKSAGGSLFFEEDGEEDYEEWLEEMVPGCWPSEDDLPGAKSLTGEYGLAPGSREEKMILRAKARYDFSRYLRRYSSMKEEIRIDQSGFDYIPYYYGLERYGNMPLIEALEYAESYKVEDLVIAIDTSGSCSIEIVERFLAEIEHILMEKDNFFRRMNVHIIQCDARVQSHVAIHSIDEWKEYIRDLSIKGRGGTDFNPVFDLVAKLRKEGQLKKLKGLLYFTDGNGVYPQEKTPYETAFVFTAKAALEYNIPQWIVPLCLDMDF